MKKSVMIAGIVALAALPACTNQGQNGWSSQRGGQDNMQYAGHDRGRDMDHGDHKGMMEDKANMMTDQFFAKADRNKDGYISRKEMDAFKNDHFKQTDTNHDGKLSRDEVMTMKRQEMKEMHEEMHASMRDNDQDSYMRSDSDMRSDNMRYDSGTRG